MITAEESVSKGIRRIVGADGAGGARRRQTQAQVIEESDVAQARTRRRRRCPRDCGAAEGDCREAAACRCGRGVQAQAAIAELQEQYKKLAEGSEPAGSAAARGI